MVLCDHAQAADEKLYVLGGGWKHVPSAETPFPAALAVLVEVPWTETNEKHGLLVQLVDYDGALVGIQGKPVQTTRQFEVARPAGVKAGTALNQPMAYRFDLVLPAGVYVFELSINGRELARTPFRIGPR